VGPTVVAQDAPPAPEEKPASVEGTVTNSLTGEPLARAHVTFNGYARGKQLKYGAISRADGKFTIAALPAGNYSATAERVGFVKTGENGQESPEQVKFGAGDRKTDLSLKLTPAGAIAGRVLGADGESMESIEIEAVRSGTRAESTETDDQGNFRIGGLTPGKYRIRAKPDHLPSGPTALRKYFTPRPTILVRRLRSPRRRSRWGLAPKSPASRFISPARQLYE